MICIASFAVARAINVPRVNKVLVANRGEIALRVFRAARELGLGTVAVVAPDDTGSLHARSADETVADPLVPRLRGAHPSRASRAGADAIHPGYGFLAESGDFAEAVEAAGLIWIGPPPDALRAGGDKLAAKRVAAEAGVPTIPEASEPPLIVKAAAGGGGRGMRVVRSRDELDDAVDAARREAKAAFGDDRVYLERYLERPRHVEIQLLADAHGTVLALGERDCSVQRRHQKVLEESPSPALDADLRAQMSDAASASPARSATVGAGTAEFVVEGREFFFLELNGRIQVEHPVTEAVTGIDLVAVAAPHRARRAARRRRRRCTATPSRCGSTRRIRGRSCRRRAASSACGCPRRCASTRASPRATRSGPATTR